MLQRPRIFFIIGEHSGDLHASLVAQALRARADVDLTGVTGWRMEAAGVTPVMRGETWGVMGIAPALAALPRLLRAGFGLRDEILRMSPDVLVPVDFGAFNVRLLRGVRRRGYRGKVLYYFPPRSWDRHRTDWRWLAPLVDRVATPFAWSAEGLKASGVDAEWVGHPVLDALRPPADRRAVRREMGLPEGGPVIGLLPGSRGAERAIIGSQLLAAANVIYQREPNARFLWSDIERLRRHDPPGVAALAEAGRLLPLADSHQILTAADAAITAMGTATLEAAAAGCPMLTAYAGTWAMRTQFRLILRKPEYCAMPNVLLQRGVVPELTNLDAPLPVAEIAAGALALCADTDARRSQLAGLAEVRAELGAPGASARTAQMILDLLPTAARGGTA